MDAAVHVRTDRLQAVAAAVQAVATGPSGGTVPPARSLPGLDAGLGDAVHDLVALDVELDVATRDAAQRIGRTLATVLDEVTVADRFVGVL